MPAACVGLQSREAQARKEVDEVRQKLEAMQAEAAEKEKRRREREVWTPETRESQRASLRVATSVRSRLPVFMRFLWGDLSLRHRPGFPTLSIPSVEVGWDWPTGAIHFDESRVSVLAGPQAAERELVRQQREEEERRRREKVWVGG